MIRLWTGALRRAALGHWLTSFKESHEPFVPSSGCGRCQGQSVEPAAIDEIDRPSAIGSKCTDLG